MIITGIQNLLDRVQVRHSNDSKIKLPNTNHMSVLVALE